MKRFIAIATLLLLCIMLFSACTPKQEENKDTDQGNPNNESAEQSDPISLDIYYIEGDACASYIVNSFYLEGAMVNATAFSSVEEMDARLATEVNANKGPDVVLFPSDTSLDTTKMAINQAFLDLSEMLTGDETYDAKNYYSVLDAGNIGGKQFLMPLRFRFPFYYTTQERMASVGMDLPENYTASQLMTAFYAAAASLDDDYCWLINLIPLSYGEKIYNPLRLSGIEIADLKGQTLSVTEEVFREYSEYAKFMEAEDLKATNIVQNFGSDFTGGQTHVYSVYMNDQFPLHLRYYEELFEKGLNETYQVLPVPNYADPTSLTADISLYAAVLQSTDAAQAAFKFVRYAMDCAIIDIHYDLPINRNSVSMCLDELSMFKGKTVKLPTGTVTIPVLSEELRLQCEQLFDRITSGSIRNPALVGIFTETMEPYIVGDAEFEDCYTKFKNQISLYLYE